MRTIVHISDLHFGRIRPELLSPMLESIAAASPDLVAISGDLTQRARAGQFAAASRFLAALPRPLLVVPGNHDVPLDAVWSRLFHPFHRYRRWIRRELEPCFQDDEVAVIGINTVSPFDWQRGWIARHAVTRACTLLGRAGARTRIVVTHHPFVHGPDQEGKAPMRGAAAGIRALAACGAEIFLSGHLHNGRAEPYRQPGAGNGAVLLVQAGTGLSTRLRTESNTYNVLRIGRDTVEIERLGATAEQARFERVDQACFVRDGSGWSRRADPA